MNRDDDIYGTGLLEDMVRAADANQRPTMFFEQFSDDGEPYGTWHKTFVLEASMPAGKTPATSADPIGRLFLAGHNARLVSCIVYDIREDASTLARFSKLGMSPAWAGRPCYEGRDKAACERLFRPQIAAGSHRDGSALVADRTVEVIDDIIPFHEPGLVGEGLVKRLGGFDEVRAGPFCPVHQIV